MLILNDAKCKTHCACWCTEHVHKKSKHLSANGGPNPFIHCCFGNQIMDVYTVGLADSVCPVFTLHQNTGRPVHLSEHNKPGSSERQTLQKELSHYSDYFLLFLGAGRSSEVERSLMVRWVVGSILHGVDPLSYFLFQPVLHDWYNKGCGMCYPVCGMVHIKEPLLLIGKSSLCGGSGFPFSLSEWSLTICLTPYNRK